MKKLFLYSLISVFILSLFSVGVVMVSAQQNTLSPLPDTGRRGGSASQGEAVFNWVITGASTLVNNAFKTVDVVGERVVRVNDPVDSGDLVNKQTTDAALLGIENRIIALETSGVIPVPMITDVTPLVTLTGNVITITGTQFITAYEVEFAGGLTAAPTVVSNTTITVTIPSGALSGPVTVRTSGGVATSAQSLVLAEPIVITEVNGIDAIEAATTPPSGVAGDTVVITGSGFLGAQSVTFPGGVPAASFSIGSDTQITTQIPASMTDGSSGLITVSRTNPTTSDSFVFGVENIHGFASLGLSDPALVVPADGMPFVAGHRFEPGVGNVLVFLKCTDVSCGGKGEVVFSFDPDDRVYNSETRAIITQDGLPFVFYNYPRGVRAIKCNDAECSTWDQNDLVRMSPPVQVTLNTFGYTHWPMGTSGGGFDKGGYANFSGISLAPNGDIVAIGHGSKPHRSSGGQERALTFLRCADWENACDGDSVKTIYLNSAYGNLDGLGLAVPSNNLPIITYNEYRMMRCTNSSCSSLNDVDYDPDFISDPFMGGGLLAQDGNPLFFHKNSNRWRVVKCSNSTCSSSTSYLQNYSVSSIQREGAFSYLTNDGNGYFVFSLSGSLRTGECSNASCSDVVISSTSIPFDPYGVVKGLSGAPVMIDRSGQLLVCSNLTCTP